MLLTPTSIQGGVFDGHGGDEVSKELERTLLQNIHQKVSEAQARNPEDIRGIEVRQSHANLYVPTRYVVERVALFTCPNKAVLYDMGTVNFDY